jgi:hypothetical protein
MTDLSRRYRDLSRLETFEERFDYLMLDGRVGLATFGFDRWMNQRFYRSPEWKWARNAVIVRDRGCDLGVPGYELHFGPLLIHHMNPITELDLLSGEDWILDPEYLITTSMRTHNAIHYGNKNMLPPLVADRRQGDTNLW